MKEMKLTDGQQDYLDACVRLSEAAEKARAARRALTVGDFDDMHTGQFPVLRRVELNCSFPGMVIRRVEYYPESEINSSQ